MTGTEITRRSKFRFRLRNDREDSPKVARTLTRSVLESLALDHLIDDAVLIVSELVGNAVLHAPRTDHILYLIDEGEAFRIGVWDSNPVQPQAMQAGLLAESGRGLFMVAALSVRHGCDPHNGGKVVWALLATNRSGKR